MLSSIGFSRVRNAKNRIQKERKFLGTLSTQCDDEDLIDQILSEDGQPLGVSDLVPIVASNAGKIRFVAGTSIVGLDTIRASFETIQSCQATLKKFGGRQR